MAGFGTAGKLRDEVIGDSVHNTGMLLGAIGMGFLGALMGFVPMFGIIIGLFVMIAAYMWVKSGKWKILGLIFGAAAFAAAIAGTLWGNAAQANAISADFKAQTGIWQLFGYAMYPIDLTNQYIFNKAAGTTWNQVRGVTFPSTAAICAGTTPAGAALGGSTPSGGTCAFCNAV